MLNPAGIAIVGASDDPNRIGGRPVRMLLDRGYRGAIYPVNPKYSTVQGLPAFPNVEAVPADAELYIVCLPAEAAIATVEQAGEQGARAAVVFSGGFAEAGPEGMARQERLHNAAAKHQLALMGPNCLGFVSFTHGSVATFSTALQAMPAIEPGGIALLAQSGGVAFNLLAEAAAAGARFSHVITSGNESSVSFADYLEYLAADQHTSAVIGYLEGVRDGSGLAQALESLRTAGKPVFLIKTGASERGTASVASHTAQLSGDDAAFDALFHRYGVTRLSTLDEAVDVARALALDSAADGLAVATNSGGTGVYVVDTCERYGVPLADLAAPTRDALAEALPGFAGLNNPIDMTAQVINDPTLLPRTLAVLDEDPHTDLILLFLGSMEYLSDQLISTVVQAQEQIGTPLLVSWLGVSERVRTEAAQAGLRVCAEPARALRGLGLMRRGVRAVRLAPGGSAAPSQSDPMPLPPIEPRRLPQGRWALDEWQTMTLLAEHGTPLPARELARTPDEAAEAARRIGYPVVLKLLEPLLAHRARAGGVVTGITEELTLRETFARMRHEHGARRVIVAQQVEAGPELILGVLADPIFGTRAVLGAGGIWANELDDARTLVPPFDASYIAVELERLRAAEMITGASPNVSALADAVAALLAGLGSLVRASAGRIVEIECNPVVVSAGRPVVLDALAFVEPVTIDEEQP